MREVSKSCKKEHVACDILLEASWENTKSKFLKLRQGFPGFFSVRLPFVCLFVCVIHKHSVGRYYETIWNTISPFHFHH